MEHAVQWASTQETFERAAQALLHRMYADTAQELVIPNGRGGDGGVDGLVVIEDRRLIFQLKFFPEGFSGGFGKRREQITRSYASAMDDDPTDWILVVPCTLTRSEHAFLQKLHDRYLKTLAEDDEQPKAPSIRVLDVPALDSEIARHKDLVDLATRDEPLLRRAEAFRLEQSELMGGIGDITERLSNLQSIIDSKDEHWTVDPAIVGGSIVHTIRAKHARSAELSPISFSIQANPQEAGSAFMKDAQRVLGFGAREPLKIEKSKIAKVEFQGPQWLMPEKDIEEIIFLPDEAESEPKPVDIVAEFGDGRPPSYHTGEATATQGPLGAIIACTFYAQNVEIGVPKDLSNEGWLTFEISKPDCSVADALGLSALMEDMSAAKFVEIRVSGLPLASFKPGEMPEEAREGEAYFRELAEDLRVIEENAAGARFHMPKELPVLDRIEIRNLRLMLEGKVAVHPQFNVFTFTLSGEKPEELLRVLSGRGHFMVSPEQDTQFVEVLGRQIRVPGIRALLVDAELLSGKAIQAAIDEGTAAGVVGKLRARGGDNVRLFMPGRLPRPDSPLLPEPWGLTGIEQVGIGDSSGAQPPPLGKSPSKAPRRAKRKGAGQK